MALTGVVVTRTQNSFNLLDVLRQRAIEINVAAPIADYPGRKAPVVQRPRLKCQVTSLLKLQRMDHVGIKPANNAREPGGSRRPAFRKSRGEHLRPVCAQGQRPESPLAKGLACAIRAATGVTVGCDIPKVGMPRSFRGGEDMDVPFAPDDLVDPTRGVHARRTHHE